MYLCLWGSNFSCHFFFSFLSSAFQAALPSFRFFFLCLPEMFENWNWPIKAFVFERHVTLGQKTNFLFRNYQEFDAWKMWILWKLRLWKCELYDKWDFENVSFVKNGTLQLWILGKIRFWKCEFCEKWDFENVNFVKSEILKLWIFG